MVIQIFRPLENDTDTFQGNKLGDLTRVGDFSYTRRFAEFGEFSLTVPAGTLFASQIDIDTLLYIDYSDWWVVREVTYQYTKAGQLLIITGLDLKGLLTDRITLYGPEQASGALGYDVVQGSTESVLKHYITNNMAQPEDDSRRVVGLVVAPDMYRGLEADTYMSRLEPLHELAAKVCKNACMVKSGYLGYDITVNLQTNQMIFDVMEPVDKTESQTIRNRVVFRVDRNNVATLEEQRSAADEKNVFYTTKSGGKLAEEALTVLYTPQTPAPKGIHRREMNLNVSVSAPVGEEISDMLVLAAKEAENYKPVHSFTVRAARPEEYGVFYTLGDVVTVADEQRALTMDAQITEVRYDQGNLYITFGNKEPTRYQRLSKKILNKGV